MLRKLDASSEEAGQDAEAVFTGVALGLQMGRLESLEAKMGKRPDRWLVPVFGGDRMSVVSKIRHIQERGLKKNGRRPG